MTKPSFKHSGSMGDCIFSLAAVKSLGGGFYYLNNGPSNLYWTRLYGDPYDVVAPLIRYQRYITGVQPWRGEAVNYDMDYWRCFYLGRRQLRCFSIVEAHIRQVGGDAKTAESPWIESPVNKLSEGRVVINRTIRYRNPFFRWERIMKQYGKDAIFTGLREEYDDFRSEFPKVDYFPTENLLELSSLIAGCRLFIGNQSCAFVIAEALKKDLILEVSPNAPHGMFYREGARMYMRY